VQRFLGGHRTTPQIWQHAQALLARSRPGDFNQAMMELGATVCVPGEPRCLVCPIRRWCVTQPSRQAGSRPITRGRRSSRPAKRHPRFVRRRRTSGVCSTSAMAESARATAKEGLTHARHVGIAAIIRASTSLPPPRSGARFAIPSPLPTTQCTCFGMRR